MEYKYAKNGKLPLDLPIPNSIGCDNLFTNYVLTDSTKSIDENQFLDYTMITIYKKGLGLQLRRSIGMVSGSGERLIYYKKNNYTSGTKLEFRITSIVNNFNTLSSSIYPNPTSGIFTVSKSSNELFTISITDILGTEIYHTQSITNSTTFDLSQKPKGIYFITIEAHGKTASYHKIVLQ